MLDGKRVLAIIPARGGSKGVPKKNIRALGGKPLIAWSIAAARGSTLVDRTIVSTDDETIAEVVRTHGGEVPFLRPAALATDEARSIDVVYHALDALPGHDLVVLLQPTSPLRTAADIDAAIERLSESKASSCVSVVAVAEPPEWMYRLGPGGTLAPVVPQADVDRRQDLPRTVLLNGAIYVADSAWLRRCGTFVDAETVGYLMPASRSLDIDTEEDFAAAESYLRAGADR